MAIDKVNIPQMFFLPDALRRDLAWQPRADVYRTQEGWLVKLELAGVRMDEIHLVTQDHWLIVQGTRRDDCCCAGTGCHCLEIAYSHFRRALELPGLSESAEMATSYVDGMLMVRINTRTRS